MNTFQLKVDPLTSLALGFAACLLVHLLCDTATAQDRPNIVLIMSDDMGYSDIGCYGGEINTPNLDSLAAGGLRFTQFYNTSRCCPTRASLLTGLYPHQTGIGHMADHRITARSTAAYNGDLNKSCMTIAEVLGRSGYSTYMSGKWHVTRHISPDGPKHNWPRQRGFDRFFGTIWGAGSFYDPNSLTLENTQIAPGDDFYYTDAISDRSVKYIDEHEGDKPFFMYVSYTAAHWPMQALPRDIEKYQGRYDAGWDALRKERYERMIEMGLIDRRWSMTERDPAVPAWDDVDRKEWHIRCMEVYAAMIDNMDQGIGRIVDALRRTGKLDNTLIFFLQDNGACAEGVGIDNLYDPDAYQNMPLMPMADGELQTRMIPQVTRDGRPVRMGVGLMPGADDTYLAYGVWWANASNTPFRRYKHWSHEGGIATPLIVHWPSRVKAKGDFRAQPGHLIDIMATCVDVASAEYPDEYNGVAVTPLEGRSLVPALDDKPIEREAIFWEHEGNRAIRVGQWKLVAEVRRLRRVTPADEDAWELYDMEADRTETHDLATEQPDRAKRMIQQWDTWAKRTKVLPWPW